MSDDKAAKLVRELVTDAMDIVLAVLLTMAEGNKATALAGVEALHKDMLANVEKFYAEAKV